MDEIGVIGVRGKPVKTENQMLREKLDEIIKKLRELNENAEKLLEELRK